MQRERQNQAANQGKPNKAKRQRAKFVFFLFFGVRPHPPPRRGRPSCRKAPSRSRSRTFSSLHLVHKTSGDHAISTQQCITASSRRADCDPIPKSQSESSTVARLQEVSYRPQISDLYDYAGPQELGKKKDSYIGQCTVNPKP